MEKKVAEKNKGIERRLKKIGVDSLLFEGLMRQYLSIAKIFDGNRIKINDGLESGAGRRRSHFCL
jgi:hypothetical protein